jgi:hypothetical protein
MFRKITVPIFGVTVYLTDLPLEDINDRLNGYRINYDADGTYLAGEDVVVILRDKSLKRLCEEMVIVAHNVMGMKDVEYSVATMSLIVGYLIEETNDSIKKTRPIGFGFRK